MADKVNKDLVWHIGEQHYTESKVRFLKRFETALCLFSKSVAQVYSNYRMVPCSASGDIIAYPNPHAYHDIFNRINSDAIIPTGIRIVPSEFINAVYRDDLAIVYRAQKTGKIVSMPLSEGIRQLEQRFGAGKFLPIMINTDLQLIDGKIPAMHLHRVELDKLHELSLFHRSDLQLTIETKMGELLEQVA